MANDVEVKLEDRPGIPRERAPGLYVGDHLLNPDQQIPTVQVFKSIERPTLTPVFGTTCPPRGLSGLIRRFAYTFGEGKMQHWLLLLFADRVDVVEGVVEDLAKGHVPNFFKEAGYPASWKYDKTVFAKRVGKNLLMASLVVGGVLWLRRKRKGA
jgi:hypothetical protein